MKKRNPISRRDFIKLSGATAIGIGIAGCNPTPIAPLVTALPPTATITPSTTPTATMTASPTPTLTSTNTPEPTETLTSTPDITTLRGLADLLGMEIGTTIYPDKPSSRLVGKHFNLAVVQYSWMNREPVRGSYKLNYFKERLSIAQKAKMSMRLNHIFFRETYPGWLKEIHDRDTVIEVVRKQTHDLIYDYGRDGVRDFNVINEPFPKNNHLMSILGESYIDIAYEEALTAREAVTSRRMGAGYPDPGIRLGFSNAENHFAAGYGTRETYKYLKRLVEKGYLDYLDVHFHIKKYYDLPNPKDVVQTLKSYFDYGIDVIVGELDVNIHGMPGTLKERFSKQADIYRTYFTAILEAGVKSITFWDFVDNESWYEEGWLDMAGHSDADAGLFGDDLLPKPSYFAVLDILKQKAGFSI